MAGQPFLVTPIFPTPNPLSLKAGHPRLQESRAIAPPKELNHWIATTFLASDKISHLAWLANSVDKSPSFCVNECYMMTIPPDFNR
jgi:hypothetical protein